MKIETVEEFECPKCGSNWFGTDPFNNIRQCHGETGCSGFRWPIADDWKYTVIKTIQRFESKKEFEANEIQEG